ncbi:ribonuclease HII [Caulobacter endophyticus]|uniref:Ribonuclease HII n=1 Tax=Caulobacter endophyticus TaxID=2172652 RepID=A0A2T9KE82_9CAUL|nr:ribonuclease HII [Caulobacter endophyticus]PVM94158.1 ribonuclease HII [Caulobacter endophyticus]
MPSGPDMMLEAACGPGPVCGVDEAGRGPWAGPVSAAAVILDPARVPKGLNDSKKLSAKARAALEDEIKDVAIAWCVGMASVEEIAQLNILHAAGLAMRRAVEGLSVAPSFALVDGNYRFVLPCEVKTVVKGDALSCSIAAASILAKEARDRIMVEMDSVYPGYGFAGHKGYHAPIHLEGLRKLGPSPIHRLGWAPVKLALAGALADGLADEA